jgi:folate-binding protein YgfZ
MIETEDATLLARGVCALPLGAWEVLRAHGADRLRFLHGLLTADIQGTTPGHGVRSCLLDTKGHVVSDLRVLVRENDLLLIVEAGQGAPTATALSRYAIMDDCQIETLPDWSVLPVLGPEATAVLESREEMDPAWHPWPRTELSHSTGKTLVVCRVRHLGAAGVWLIGEGAALVSVEQSLAVAGVARLSGRAAEAARIAAGEPAWGREVSSARFPLEIGLAHTIAATKGCYLGQEPIVRIRDRGHVNWLLRTLTFTGDVLPEPGDELEHETRPKAGTITSVGRFSDGRGVALALVHATVAPPTRVAIRRGERLIPAQLEGPSP